MSKEKQIDYKEFARQMRENCAKDYNGNIICSAELWEQIARVVEEKPTADVVPKSEVDEIVRQWKEEANCWQNNYIAELRDNEQIKKEVAREIFEDIERYVIKGISVCGEHLTLFNGKNYSELKKKYTEGGK